MDVIIHYPAGSMNTDENALETALRIATTDSARRREFFRLLLKSDVVVLTASDLPVQATAVLESEMQVLLKCWPNPAGSLSLPFFSSRIPNAAARQHKIGRR